MKTSNKLTNQLATVRDRLKSLDQKIREDFAAFAAQVAEMAPDLAVPPDPCAPLRDQQRALQAAEAQLIADLDLATKAEEKARKQAAADAFEVVRLDAASQAQKAVAAILAGHAVLKALGLNYGGLPKPSWHGFADALANAASETGLRPVAEIAGEIRRANGGDAALHPGAAAIGLAEINPSREAVLSALEGI